MAAKQLKKSTAATVRIGPFLDKTDGVTPETGLAGSMTVYLSKNHGAAAVRNSATAISHDRDGYYLVPLSTTDTNTDGTLRITVTDAATHLPVWDDFEVIVAELRCLATAPAVMERPTSSSIVYRIQIDLFGQNGVMQDPDQDPVCFAFNHAGTDRSGNLGTVTEDATGSWYVTYTVSSSHALEELVFEWQVTHNGAVRTVHAASLVVVAIDAIKAKTDNLPSDPADQSLIIAATDAVMARLGAPAGASIAADIATRATPAQVNAECDTAIADARLDELLAVSVDAPAAGSLYAELTEDDGGVRRFTANALEQAPTGAGSNPQVLYSGTVLSVTAPSIMRIASAPAHDEAIRYGMCILFDASNGDAPSVHTIVSYDFATPNGDIRLDRVPDFTVVAGDGIVVLAGVRPPHLLATSRIGDLTSQTVFDLADGPSVDDALKGCTIVVYDVSGAHAPSMRHCTDYVGSTKRLTLNAAPDFTVGIDDFCQAFVASFNDVDKSRLDTTVSSRATDAGAADAVWDEARSGHTTAGSFGQGVASVQGNVTGSVASVSGNVDGNVTGSVGSLAAQAKADVNAEVDGALNTAIPGSPVADSVNERLQTMDNAYTATRAGYLDNLNVGGLVSSSAQVTQIQNNTRAISIQPEVMERPDSGSIGYKLHVYIYDTVGNMEAPDSTPTISAVNSAGTDRSANLGTVIIEGTGHYSVVYTVSSAHALEQLLFEWTVVEGSNTRRYGGSSLVVDTTATAALADAVWDEARSGHTTAGSFGEGIASVQGNVTGSVASVSGNVGGNVTGSVGSLAAQAKADVNAEVDSALDTAVPGTPTADSINERIKTLDDNYTAAKAANLDATISSRATPAQVNTECDTAIADARLNQLLAASLATPVAGSLFGEMTEDDGGVQRFTANALEQAPTGGGGTDESLLLSTTVATVNSQTSFDLTAGPSVNDSVLGQTVVFFDASAGNAPSVRKALDYVAASKRIIIDAAPDFTVVAGDGVKVFVTPAGASAPTTGEVADAVMDAFAVTRRVVDRAAGEITLYESDGTTPRGTLRMTEAPGGDTDKVSLEPV